jgi:hypothetical protein
MEYVNIVRVQHHSKRLRDSHILKFIIFCH